MGANKSLAYKATFHFPRKALAITRPRRFFGATELTQSRRTHITPQHAQINIQYHDILVISPATCDYIDWPLWESQLHWAHEKGPRSYSRCCMAM